MDRVIHKPHPNGQPHPFKFTSLCGKLIRFGGIEMSDRIATCKPCLKIHATICPTCGGTGIKPPTTVEEKGEKEEVK